MIQVNRVNSSFPDIGNSATNLPLPSAVLYIGPSVKISPTSS